MKKSFTLNHAGHVTVSTALPDNDIDEYLLRDENGDGEFTVDEIIAASAGGTGDESISLVNPPDGDYQVWVHGFAVTGTPDVPADDRCRPGQRPDGQRGAERARRRPARR